MQINEDVSYKLKRRKIALGEMEGEMSGYPSVDMPWLKYYTEDHILAPVPDNMSCYDYLRMTNIHNQDNIAIEYFEQKISYKGLFQNINQTSKALVACGIKPHDVVTILLSACPEEIYLFYALDQIGACANFIFPMTPLAEVEKTMELFNSRLLVVLDDILCQPNSIIENEQITIVNKSLSDKYINTAENMITWNDFQEKGNNQILPNYKRNPNEPLLIVKTGGSTGKPKNVMLSDKCFNVQAHQHINLPINYSMGDRWVRLWPLFHVSVAVTSVHLPLCYGMTQIIEPALDVDKLDELILNCRPNHLIVISHCIDSLLQSEKLRGMDLSYIKTMGIGGESISAEYEEKIERFMLEHNIMPNMTYGYGMTENASGATSRCNAETSTVGGVGIPLVNTIVKIIDPDTEEELKYGEHGEICVLSSNHMLGYYNEPEKAKAVLKTHVDGRVWLHSGDLGYMDENGQLFVKGRRKRMIMLFDGHKVYPLDLEELLETIPEIDRAAVVTENDPIHKGSVVPCAYVTLNKDIDIKTLRKSVDHIISQNCADFVKINSIYIQDELPKTAVGKTDYRKLEEMAKENISRT